MQIALNLGWLYNSVNVEQNRIRDIKAQAEETVDKIRSNPRDGVTLVLDKRYSGRVGQLGTEPHGTKTGRVGEKGQLDIIVMVEILLVSPSQSFYGTDKMQGHFIESHCWSKVALFWATPQPPLP